MKGNHVSPSVLKVTSCRRARAHIDKQPLTNCIIFIGQPVSVVDAKNRTHMRKTFTHSRGRLNSFGLKVRTQAVVFLARLPSNSLGDRRYEDRLVWTCGMTIFPP